MKKKSLLSILQSGFPYIYTLILFLISMENPFFWDTVQLGAKHALFYYQTNFQEIFLPDINDAGHIPAFGYLLAICWKVFGKTLLVSHLILLPFIIGIVYQLQLIVKRYLPSYFTNVIVLLLLIDPTLSAQLTLVSPDVPLVFFFLWGFNSINSNRKAFMALAVLGMFAMSNRGLMMGLALLLYDIYKHIDFKSGYSKLIIQLFRRSLIYLPAFLFFLFYSIFHYYEKGWVATHGDSPWAANFEIVDVRGFFFNVYILGRRFIDFGRIWIWLIMGFLFLKMRFKLALDTKNKEILFIFFALLFCLLINVIWVKNLIAHRYFIVCYLFVVVFMLDLLSKADLSKKFRNIAIAFAFVGLISGNFWVYAPRTAMGWDSTLAHLPYFELREKVLDEIDNKEIPFNEVESFFPNCSTLQEIDLKNESGKFRPFKGEMPYLVYSNVYNVSYEEYDRIQREYIEISYFKKGQLFIQLLKRK